MKIGIIGCRGIPNRYGGFEKFAEIISRRLSEFGNNVYVYSSHNHPNKEKVLGDVHIIHKYDPEFKLGTFGQFVYDLNCILDARKQNFDIIYQLGYTSSSIWFWLLPKRSVIVTNMDGLEWKRKKYNFLTRIFLKFAERLAIHSSNHLVADSEAIKSYLLKFSKPVTYASYGAHNFTSPDVNVLKQYNLDSWRYNLLVARIVPENNIEMILTGAENSKEKLPFLVIGNHMTPYGIHLKKRFGDSDHIRFMGSIFDDNVLNNLRFHSKLYFHGHSVGGTNPSLLEAMASQAIICAHNNAYNSEVLGENAHYFSSSTDVSSILDTFTREAFDPRTLKNQEVIEKKYNWTSIAIIYNDLFSRLIKSSSDQEHVDTNKIRVK